MLYILEDTDTTNESNPKYPQHAKQVLSLRQYATKSKNDIMVAHAGTPSSFFAPSLPPVRLLWINGNTPPPAIVARTSVSSSSSPRIASCKCRGVMRLTRRSFDALPIIDDQGGYDDGRGARARRTCSF